MIEISAYCGPNLGNQRILL